jgi:predicted nucleotidyltransferase
LVPELLIFIFIVKRLSKRNDTRNYNVSKRGINLAQIQIEQIKETILSFFNERNLQIKKIILFGSYNKGVTTEDSDIDLLVLSDEFENKNIFQKAKATDGLEWILVKKFKKPFDILYYSNSDWENLNSLIITEAKKTGKVIYS